MKRRHFVAGLGALGVGAALALKPPAAGAAYSTYFAALNALLRTQGEGRPHLVIDLDRLDQNIAALKAVLKPGARFRLVEKSLPSPSLIDYILGQTGSRALMSFHLPFLQQSVRNRPDSHILLGKPLPVQAAARFYRQGTGSSTFAPQNQLVWLIDTDARLDEYQQLARGQNTRLQIAVEIDVGLHRGGIPDPAALHPLLARIQNDPAHLTLAGFMGYDAHVGKIPGLLESRSTSYAAACARYRACIDYTRAQFPGLLPETPLFNGAGSPTLALHREGSPCNDLSAGSCLVKPGDFDLPTLETFTPAAFIATPVLKKLDGTRIPGIEWASGALSAWDPNLEQAYFVYGGRWLARPEAPAGLRDNSLYGYSSNQQLYTGSRATALQVNDHLFLRPTQSEAVLLQFGALLAVRQGRLEHRWPILHDDPPA